MRINGVMQLEKSTNTLTKGLKMNSNLVFDIGANNGDDSEVYLRQGYKVIAVEANPDLCIQLNKRFANEINAGKLILVDKAISRQSTVILYVNTADHAWGTTVPSYAERGKKLRGEVISVEVKTITIIDLIRLYDVPYRIKIDIEGADILCLLDLYGGVLPKYVSIERPKSLSNQMFALSLMKRMGYNKFAFVNQNDEGKDQRYTTSGLFSEQLPESAWVSYDRARATNFALAGIGNFKAVWRRTPGVKSFAPRSRWFDIHAS
jgi:FkbM family methyltransferase